MKIVPQGQPTSPNPAQSSADSARARAINMLSTPPNAQEHPVQNPSQVAVEELGAIQAPSEGQSSSSEAPQSAQAPSEGQSSSSEAPQSAPEATAAPEKPISSEYAALARKERAFRQKVAQQNAALKAERDALDKAKAEMAAKDAEYQTKYVSKQRLSEETINVLLESGISYDKITEMMLNQSTAHQDPVLKQQLAEIKAAIQEQKDATAEAKRQGQEAQTQQYQEALKQITRDATALVQSDPAFEAIKETGSVKDVVDLIEKTFKEDGVLLSVEEAAKEVEDELMGQLSKYAQKIKKLQQKFQSQSKETPQSQVNKQGQPPTKTLTNSMGASRPLSAKERAILAFKGQLYRS